MYLIDWEGVGVGLDVVNIIYIFWYHLLSYYFTTNHDGDNDRFRSILNIIKTNIVCLFVQKPFKWVFHEKIMVYEG